MVMWMGLISWVVRMQPAPSNATAAAGKRRVKSRFFMVDVSFR